jgi:hypothetical protein
MQNVPQFAPYRPFAWLASALAVGLAFSGVSYSAESHNGGQPVKPKDLKGKKVVIADVPKVIGIGYFDATSKGIAAGAEDLSNRVSNSKSLRMPRPKLISASRSSFSITPFRAVWMA